MILHAHGRQIEIVFADPGDYIGCYILKTGDFYERPMLEVIRTRAGDGCVVDVGAHVGNHTLWFAGVMERTVIACEPNPAVREQLVANIHRNQLDGHVQVVDAAIGAGPSRGRLTDPAIPGNSGTVSVVTDPDGPVRIVTLDSLDPPPVAVLKIDVEGAAFAVLAGGRKLLRVDQPLVFVEAAHPDEVTAIDALLAQFGYQRFGRFCSTPTYGYAA